MRDLTDEELALAPEWATHYDADFAPGHFIRVCFFNKTKCVNLLSSGQFSDQYDNEMGIGDEDGLIPKVNLFDITQHEWSDKECQLNNHPSICECLAFYCESSLDDDGGFFGFEINRDDAIAIAKLFKLQAEDLA